jgi:hypothetical protein
MHQPLDIHAIRQSLKVGESKVFFEQDLKDNYTIGVVDLHGSQFVTLTANELIELYLLMKINRPV